MAELRIDNPANRLPGADDPRSPSISFGEGASDAMLRFLREMADGEWHVQVTDQHGSFNARIDGIETDDRDIWSVKVTRILNDDFDEYATHDELVPLDGLLRLHVW